MVCKIPDDLIRNLVLSVGTHRSQRPLSPMEVALGIDSWLRDGGSLRDVADTLHLTIAMVSRFCSLLRLSPSLGELVKWSKSEVGLSFSTAWQIARLSLQSDQEELARATLELGLGSKEVQQVVEAVSKGIVLADAVRMAIRKRPRTRTVSVFIGAVTEQQVRSAIGQMTQTERDAVLERTLRRILQARDARGRLSSHRFVIMCGEHAASLLQSAPEGFEELVNTHLKPEVLER